MSHEIRTPLNGVVGYADLLLDDPALTGEQRRHAERIQGAGTALLTVVNDILDFSKIEAGQVSLEPRPVALAPFLDQVVDLLRGAAERKGLALSIRLDPALPDRVTGDADRLRQVLLNLLNNAIKFTAAGSVTLSCRRQEDGRDAVRFAVEDTGPGIPDDRLDRLFRRFSQVDGSIQREFGGTGLGLAISKQLAELMDGEIGVASEVGRGSTFWFTARLPTSVEASGPVRSAEVVAAATCTGLRVLVADDVAMNRDIAQAVLVRAGYAVDVVADGAQAVAAVRAAEYDLVLMDVQMPGLDGLTATGRIRAIGGRFARLPIVAMTANVLPAQVERCRAAGMDDHVGKPFRREELLDIAARWTRIGRSDGSGTAPAPPEGPPALDRAVLDELADMLGPQRLSEMFEGLSERLRILLAHAGRGEAGPSGRLAVKDLARDAHAMVSAAGGLGLSELSGLCGELEGACLAGQDLAPLLGRLRGVASRALDEMRALRAA